MSKNNFKKHVDLLWTGEDGQRHCVLVKDFSTLIHLFMIIHFSAEEILKHHVKDCFKINDKQRIKMPKKGECVRFKNYKRKIKSPFMIYADFEIILVPGNNGNQNRNESYRSKYQKHVACSYDYILVCVNIKFSMPFKLYLGEDAVYSFIKCCIDVMKKHLDKKFLRKMSLKNLEIMA